jgi:EAL domain-containing protein (putative c-di-GMP-specific phosphodiesterase class I)
MALDDVLGATPLTAVYQPVVQLETGEVLGYEALARGSQPPEKLLRAARDGRLRRRPGLGLPHGRPAGGAGRRLGNSLSLFVNVEPDSDVLVPPACVEVLERAESSLRVILEVTERAVVQRPAELLRLVDWARARGWGHRARRRGAGPAPRWR